MLDGLPWLVAPRTTLGKTGPFGWWPVRVLTAERDRHTLVSGLTGVGKSKWAEAVMVEDILAGRAVGLIDPHADLAHDVLAHLISVGYFKDAKQYRKIIYFDPTRSDYALPFNVLKSELPPYTIAQIVIEAMKRAWPKALQEAPRFTNISLVSLLVLIETGQSLVQLPKLLTDVGFRKQLLEQVQNQDLVDYFNSRFNQWGRDVAVMIEPVLNKVTAFTLNPYLKRVLQGRENRLDCRRLMDEGQTLIVDMSGLDGEMRRLLGSLLVVSMEEAALTRKATDGRKPYYLWIDEADKFSAGEGGAKTFSEILSGCRKFGLYLHLIANGIERLSSQLVSALNNAGIVVAFQSGREDAELLAKRLYTVHPEQIKYPSQTDVQIPLFSPLTEQWESWVEELQNLPPRSAWVKRRGRPPVKIRTPEIKPYGVSEDEVDQAKLMLAVLHGEAVEPVELSQEEDRGVENATADWDTILNTSSPSNSLYDPGTKQ